MIERNEKVGYISFNFVPSENDTKNDTLTYPDKVRVLGKIE